jgi:hypothetical protein
MKKMSELTAIALLTKNNFMKYKIEIREKNPIINQGHIFKAIQEAETERQAVKEVKEFYAEDFGTDPDQIEIVSIKKINF